ncbi:MAG: hypothetical protein ABSB78_06630 [Bacteroidota bacterium]
MIGHGGFTFSPYLVFDEYTTYAQEHFSVYVDGRLAFKDSIDSVTAVIPDPYIYYLTQWKPIYLPIFNRSDIELSKEVDTMQSNTKQYINVTGSIVERCNEISPTWCAFVDKVTYEIESGSEYARLYNFDKDTVYGTTVTDFTSDSLRYLCLEAVPGAQGDSVNMVVIRVTVNGITKRDSIFIVPRDTLFVTFDPPKISPGGTSNIILKRRVNGVINDLPESQSCEIGIIGGCNYGKLVTSAGEGNYFCDVVPPFQFVADSTIDTTDAVVAIRVGIFEGGGSVGKIMPAENRSEKVPVLSRLTKEGENKYRQRIPKRPNLSLRGKSESAKLASEGGCSAETFQYESFTVGDVEVEDTCETIEGYIKRKYIDEHLPDPRIKNVTDEMIDIKKTDENEGCGKDPAAAGSTLHGKWDYNPIYASMTYFITQLKINIEWGYCYDNLKRMFGDGLIFFDEADLPETMDRYDIAERMYKSLLNFKGQGKVQLPISYYPLSEIRAHELTHVNWYKAQAKEIFDKALADVNNSPLPPDWCHNVKTWEQLIEKREKEFKEKIESIIKDWNALKDEEKDAYEAGYTEITRLKCILEDRFPVLKSIGK